MTFPPIPRPGPGPHFHYTSLAGLESIIHFQQVQICFHDGEFVAWASAEPLWCMAATASMTFADRWGAGMDLFAQSKPLPVARVRINPAVLWEWSALLSALGYPHGKIQAMKERAELIGAVSSKWAACPRPIPYFDWEAVEVWSGGQWVDIADAPGLDYLATLARVVMANPAPQLKGTP